MNRDKFDEIYNRIISLWPERIDVKEKTLHKEGGATIPNFNSAHDKIDGFLEDSYPEYNDETAELIDWSKHIDWSIVQLLHLDAKKPDCEVIYPQKLDKEAVLKRCLEHEEFAPDWVD